MQGHNLGYELAAAEVGEYPPYHGGHTSRWPNPEASGVHAVAITSAHPHHPQLHQGAPAQCHHQTMPTAELLVTLRRQLLPPSCSENDHQLRREVEVDDHDEDNHPAHATASRPGFNKGHIGALASAMRHRLLRRRSSRRWSGASRVAWRRIRMTLKAG